MKVYIDDIEIPLAEAVELNRVTVDENGTVWLAEDIMHAIALGDSVHLRRQ